MNQLPVLPTAQWCRAVISGNTVTATDQASKSRKSVSDALGRLTGVYEDPSGLNYQTSYSYDVLNDLTQVSQGSQTRTFIYDSLKRLTSATAGFAEWQRDDLCACGKRLEHWLCCEQRAEYRDLWQQPDSCCDLQQPSTAD
ncbi:MAG TPA: RHS repeat domain-containing protein [Pyrinomonadaceae bacterium]